jgi:hypothetical protein
MRFPLLAVCVSGLVAVFHSPAAAQELPPVTRGMRVRVWAPDLPDERQAGTLVDLRGDTLFLQPELQADTVGIPRAAVTRLEISRGQRLLTGEGAFLGFTIGAGAGALVGLLVGNGQDCDGGCGGLGALLYGGIGAGAGLIIGTIVGGNKKTDRWEEVVPPDRFRIGFLPQRGGRIALTASVSF